jgi:hypothetical protein
VRLPAIEDLHISCRSRCGAIRPRKGRRGAFVNHRAIEFGTLGQQIATDVRRKKHHSLLILCGVERQIPGNFHAPHSNRALYNRIIHIKGLDFGA